MQNKTIHSNFIIFMCIILCSICMHFKKGNAKKSLKKKLKLYAIHDAYVACILQKYTIQHLCILFVSLNKL